MELALSASHKEIGIGEKLLRHVANDDEKQKASKCGNRKMVVKGEIFDSKWEYHCWLMLESLEKKGVIRNLERQYVYSFTHNEVYITKFVADFKFELHDGMGWREIAADAKSEYTKKFARVGVTKRLMRAFYGMEVHLFISNSTNIVVYLQELVAKWQKEQDRETKKKRKIK